MYLFAPHKTENVRTTVDTTEIREILLVYFLEPPLSNHVFVYSAISVLTSRASSSHSTNFCSGVRLRFYEKRSYERSICIIGLIFSTGDVTNSGLNVAFFTFLIRGVPDS